MQYKFIKPTLLIIVISLSSFTFFQFEKNQILQDLLMSVLNQAHYSPLKVDDEFSEKAYNLYLKRIDISKKFLLQSDVDAFSKYKKILTMKLITEPLIFINYRLILLLNE